MGTLGHNLGSVLSVGSWEQQKLNFKTSTYFICKLTQKTLNEYQ